jgi:DNA-directed RNA polymerase sigma subunit (sigma70/sigma32)
MNAKTRIQNDLEMTPDQGRHWYATSSPMTFPIRRAQYPSKVGRPSLSDEQQLAFIRQIQAGDARALRKMIAHNMHLVIDFVRPHTDRGLPMLFLVKEGIDGLTQALKHFKPGSSSGFSTYASGCIFLSIERAVLDMAEGATAALATPARKTSIRSSSAHNGGHDD